MLTRKEIRKCVKDDHALYENLETQPYKHQRIFAKPRLLTESWYPICSSRTIKKNEAKSFALLRQRIVLYRTSDSTVHGLDAFCPHLGADLGNGRVVGDNIQCIYHKWEFSPAGKLAAIPCGKGGPKGDNILGYYPVVEKFGYIWIYSAETATYEIPNPPMLTGETRSFMIKKNFLKVHPHVLMLNAVDLSHFKTLHNLDFDFEYEVTEEESICQWNIDISMKSGRPLLRLAKFLFGPTVEYKVLYAGGTVTGISLCLPGLFNGRGPRLPSINILWGAVPTLDGVGHIYNFLVVKKYSGVFGYLKSIWAFFVSLLVLLLLKDDEVFLFPNMRFNVGNLTDEDKSLAKLIQITNKLRVSKWTNQSVDE